MVVAIRSLRVTADMDGRQYAAGGKQIDAANTSMAATSVHAAQAMARTDRQAEKSGGALVALSRQFVDGYKGAADFERAVARLGVGIEKGAVPLDRVDALLAGIYRKFGLTADASALMQNGQIALGNAAANLNARLEQQSSAADAAAAAQRELAESYRLSAAAARAEQAADTVQARYNQLLGVGSRGTGDARASAAVFEAELGRMEDVARQKAEQTGRTFTEALNERLVAGTAKSARDAASTFEAEFARLEDIARMKAQQAGQTFQQELNDRLRIGSNAGSARESASVFEAAEKEAEGFAAKAANLRAQLDPLHAAQSRLNAELQEYNLLAARGEITTMELAAAQQLAQARFNQTADMVKRMGGASQGAAFQQRNLMFQINDTVQSLALGMPVMQVFLQQGPQIAQIYGPSEGGIGRAFRETGKLIGGVLTKFPLVTAGVLAIGAAFAGLTYEINKTTDVFVGFGDVALASLQVLGGYIWDELKPAVNAISPWFQAAWDGVIAGVKWLGNGIIATIKSAIDVVEFNVGNIPAAFKLAGEAAANAFIAGIEWMVSKALQGIKTVRDQLQGIVDWVGASGLAESMGFSGKLPEVGTDFKLGRMDIGGASARADMERRQKDLYRNIGANYDQDYLGNYFKDVRDQAIKNATDDDDKKKKGGRGERESDYERTIRRIRERTEAEREDTRVINLSTYARERQAAVQDILTAAQRDGLDIGKAFANAQELINASTDKLSPALAAERQRILDVAGAYAQARADAEKAEEAQRKFKELMEFAKETTRGFIQDFRGALGEGATVWEAFAQAALNALDKVVDKLLNDVLDAIFKVNNAGGGGGGGILGSLFGGLFGGGGGGFQTNTTLGSFLKNGFANGGVFDQGINGFSNQIVNRPTVFAFAKGAGLMGEAGPEAIMPLRRDASGRLGVSASMSRMFAPGNDNGDGTVGRTVIQLTLSPELRAEILREARGQSVEIVKEANVAQQNYRQNGGE